MRIEGIRPVSAAAAGLAMLCLWNCMEGPTQIAKGGGGSEAVALVGTFTYSDERPAAYASVRLRPRLFLSDTVPGGASAAPGTVQDATTDSAGTFRMDSVQRGDYFLEITDGDSRGLLIPCTLTGDSEVVELEPAALQPTGAVVGSIVAPEGFAGRTFVQVYGLDRRVETDAATGRFRMGDLPQGTYTLRAVNSAPAVDPREIASVAAVASDTTDIGAVRLASFENENYSAWPFSRRIYLNTTPAGADVAGDVEDFPLLVRLTAAEFDFSASPGRGRDLRFADAQGKRLRYEVERWDSAGAEADLWVRLDRVQGKSDSQYVTLYWGLQGAEDVTDARTVFGADAGFAGVWHLGEDAADTLSPDLYKDAVGYDPAADRVASANREGVVGFGASFNGSDYITVPVANPLLQPNAMLSVSAWMRSSRVSVNGGNILSMGDSYNLRILPNGGLRFNIFTGDFQTVDAPKSVNLLDSAWHRVAGTFDGATLALYVDGRQVAEAAAKGFLDYRFWPAFVIGRHGNRKAGYDFIGSLDEVEVAGETARSPDWMRLEYENQKPGSALVEFRP